MVVDYPYNRCTIIPLDPDSSESTSALNGVSHFLRRSDDTAILDTRAKNYRSLNCNDCNRKFCLDYDLPTCHGAKEDDVFTTCFQRDSRKDQAIVFMFIIATGSLLAWAIFKPWVEKWLESGTFLPGDPVQSLEAIEAGHLRHQG
ncbi:peptidyl-prolyl cis-trans isomerase [Aspergillus luchuensis]|uniref:Peptidyl-prolyl cis-trans isomerase n=1 Tax=Aspergillus kawachii TaxID=1069201 RepID=A0A146FT14_ASPKA|nr:peptidyl-prolyl cis-trans isomerase [Aspergillus luchuensis]